MPLDHRSFDSSFNHSAHSTDKIHSTTISKTRSRSPSPTRSPPRLPPMPPSPYEQHQRGLEMHHASRDEKRLVPNWLLSEARSGDSRVPSPRVSAPSWKGIFPVSRDGRDMRDEDGYPMPPPSSYPFSLGPSKPRPVVGYPPVNTSYKGYDHPSSFPRYPEHFPSDPYKPESPHSFSSPKYVKSEEYREHYSRSYEHPTRRSPPTYPESYRGEHVSPMYIDPHMPLRHDYYESYPSSRHHDSHLNTSIRRNDISRSDPDVRTERGRVWDRRAESSPDFDSYRHEEQTYDLYRRRQEAAPKGARSPPSPPSYSSRPYSPYHNQEAPIPASQPPFPPKLRASPFPPERNPSRSPSPHHSDSHPSARSTPSPNPAPIFTMESPGGFSIGADGKAATIHPKNPVKFEFKDFKENEYNLHSLQNSGGNASLLSLKQQKRHKRIINRALAQGQARARARAQAEASSTKSESVDQQYEKAQSLDAERKRRALRSDNDIKQEQTKSAKRKSLEDNEADDFVPEDGDQESKKSRRASGDCVIEQFGTYEELHQNMVKTGTRASSRLRSKPLSGNIISGRIHCICNRPETDSMVQCDSCDKWFHLECVGLNEAAAQEIMQYFCADCRARGSLTKKVRIEDLIAESDQPSRSPNDSLASSSSSDQSPLLSPRETSEDTIESDEEDLLQDDDTIQLGDGVVSISSLAKQPWLDGWVTARSLAVRYLKEAKRLGHEITENRRLPKQIAVRNSGKGKTWRQAEVLLAIQFLKTADLVETSTKKGTLVREPCRTMDDLISKAQTVEMPNRNNIGKVKVVEFARQRNQPQPTNLQQSLSNTQTQQQPTPQQYN